MAKRYADRFGSDHGRYLYEQNRKKILTSDNLICGYCGKPIDKSVPPFTAWAATVDHIIPLDKGGHPYALDNLQPMHFICNRLKSNRMPEFAGNKEEIGNGSLPLSMDYSKYIPIGV